MKTLKLTPRLYAIARLAESGNRITDVGTDHGYIPIWLALREFPGELTATDLRKGPLANAKHTAAEQGVYDRIRFVLCDGLDFKGADNSDTVIIAGMGGETMMAILESAPWTKSGVRLLLQPQSKFDELCVWLAENNYVLNDAILLEDTGRLYTVLSISGSQSDEEISPTFIEDVLIQNHDALLERWLYERIAALTKAFEGMSRAKDTLSTDNLQETQARLLRIKEEADK